ncbi:MAG: hypothetical protein EXR79_02140 [Myxococcales bacterium]|nr:hypothetical protein [Myxococcales bacterium]
MAKGKQVNPPGPKSRVKSAFGNKGALVDAILALSGATPDGSRAKLMQAPNSRLLSHHRAASRMVKEFGSKDGVVTAILALRFPKGAPAGDREKLERFSSWRLLDLHRQATTAGKV